MISARHWIQTGSGVDKWDSGFHRHTTAERPDAAAFWAARISPRHFREPFKPRIVAYFLSVNIYLLDHSFSFKSTFLNPSLILVSLPPYPTLPFPYAFLYFLRSFLLGAVGWSTVLQSGRSRGRCPMVSLEFFIDITLPAAQWLWGRLSF